MAIKPKLFDNVVRKSHVKAQSRSQYIGNLLEQSVEIADDEDPVVVGVPMDQDAGEFYPVICKIPESYEGDSEKLKSWIKKQTTELFESRLDDSIIPVMLKIPKSFKDEPEKLKQWMANQMKGIFQALTAKKSED